MGHCPSFRLFALRAGLYKLSTLFPHDPQVSYGKFGCPSTFADRKLLSHVLTVDKATGQYVEGDLRYPCPAADYVEPEFIDLLITDTGGYTPSYVYRLLSEYYSREDYVLHKDMIDKMVGH